MRSLPRLTFVVAGLLVAASAFAQPRAIPAADYAHAEKFMGYNTDPLVLRAGVRPNWLPDDRFWYRVTTAEGSEFILIDPARGTRVPAFDHARVASALSAASGNSYDAAHLPFQSFEFSDDGRAIAFSAAGRRWKCDPAAGQCSAEPGTARSTGGRGGRGGGGGRGGRGDTAAISPDGKHAAFIRDWNLWVREIPGGKETQLTTDGVKDFGYATDNAGWTHSDRPVVVWSPDSQ